MRKFFKQFVATFLIIILQMNCIYYVNATDLQQDYAEKSSDKSNISFESSDSIGNILAKKSIEQPQQGQNNIYIESINFSGNEATIIFTTDQDAELVLAIYDENERTKMLTAEKNYISAGATNTSVILDPNKIPKYFVAKAFLLDCNSHKPLCDSYTTNLYTKAVQNLKNSTADDYAEKEVIQFEEDDKDTNFGVYNNETIVEKENFNSVQISDNGNDVYTISNANSDFKSLKKGDTFSYQYNNGSLILVKVQSVSVDNDKVIVHSDDTANLTDFFDYLKIESNTINTKFQSEESAIAVGDAISDDKTSQKELSFNGGIDNINISGKINIISSYSYYLVTWPFSVEYLSFNTIYEVNYSIQTSETKKLEEIPLITKQEIPIGNVIKIPFELNFVCKVSGKVKFTDTISGIIGYSYENGHGFCNRSQQPSFNRSLEVSAALYWGFDFSIGISILTKKLCYVGLKASPGFEFTESMSLNQDILHECSSCICGKLSKKFTLNIEMSYIKLATTTVKKTEQYYLTLINQKTDIGDFYYSFDYGDHDLTTCPHISYPVKIIVKNHEKIPVENSEITVIDKTTRLPVKIYLKNGNKAEKTDSQMTTKSGIASIYLPNGNYIIKARKGKYKENGELLINNNASDIEIILNEDINITPTPTGMPEPVDSEGTDKNISWKLMADGTLYINGTGKMPNYGRMYSSSKKQYITVPTPWEDVKPKIKKVIMEEGLLNIGNTSFSGCSNLNTAILPTTINQIGEDAFSNCGNLLKITLPINITSIKVGAFSNCTSLKEITLPDNLQTLEGNTFMWCSNLEKIDFPSNLSQINDQVFTGCSSLREITFPNKLEKIGAFAFMDCTALESITLPGTFNSTSKFAFTGCTNLKNIIFTEKEPSVKHISLARGTFGDCSSLESITLTGIQSLADAVFDGCSNLKFIYFTGEKPVLNEAAFFSLDSVTIYYPKNDETWNGIETETFAGNNILWKTYNVSFEEDSENAPAISENDFTDGQIVNDGAEIIKEDSLTESDTEQSTALEQPTDEQDVEIADEDSEIILQTLTPSVVKAQERAENSLNSCAYNDRKPGSYTLFVVVKSKNTPDLLSTDNLLYINQGTADENGFISFTYKFAQSFSNPIICIFGDYIHKHNYGKWTVIKKATVWNPEMRQRTCNGCGKIEKINYGKKLKPTINVSASSVTLKVRQSTTGLKVTKIARGDAVVSWKSSNTKIVKVNKKGKLTAQNRIGKTIVTVKLKSGISKKITVVVQKSPIKTNKISGLPKTLTLKAGKKYALKPVLQPFTSLEKITYNSSNKKIIYVSSKGIVKGLKKGAAKVIVKSGTKKFIVTIKVK